MDFGLREILFIIGLIFIVGIMLDGVRRVRKSRGDLFGLPPDYDQINIGHSGSGTLEQDQIQDDAGVIDLQAAGGPDVQDVSNSAQSYPHSNQDAGVANQGDGLSPSILESDVLTREATLPRQASHADASDIGRGAREMIDSATVEDEELKYNDELPNGGARKVITESAQSTQAAEPTPVVKSTVKSTAVNERVEPKMGAGLDRVDGGKQTGKAFSEGYQSNYQSNKQTSDADIEPTLGMDTEVEDVIVFNIIAKNKGTFSGQTLLKSAEMCHMELGKMNIFHRYESSASTSAMAGHGVHGHSRRKRNKLFSMANLVEPGTFNPESMHDFKSPGVCLFMQLPGPSRSIAGLELMVDTARKMAIKLNAEMRDENHSVITPQTIEHYRQRVMEFERKRRARRMAELSH